MIEQQKKQRALKIGIFTVFLVVCMITMLKSVVDSSPIIFVKIGQEQAGAIDYQLTSPTYGNQYSVADMNQYSINPFCNPFNYSMQPYDDTTCAPEEVRDRLRLRDDPPDKPSVYDTFSPQGDHVYYYSYDPETGTSTAFSLAMTQYFLEKLADVGILDGFFPRWVIPGTLIKPSEFSSEPIST